MRILVLFIIFGLLACAPKNPEWVHTPYIGTMPQEPLVRSIEICDLKARVVAHKGDSYDPVDPEAFNIQTYKDCMRKKGWRAQMK